MPLFGRRAPQPDDPAPHPRAPLTVLRADGRRIDLTARDTPARLTATKQAWQTTALAYRKLIGELRYAQRLRAQAVAQARFYLAAVQDWPAGPIALTDPDHGLDPQLVADALTNFARIPFDNEPDGYTARFDENMNAVGEVYIHIDPDDRFRVRSISEVTVGLSGIAITDLPGGQGARPIDPNTESLLRCWRPDLEYGELADAAMSSLLDVAEDVVLAGRELRAASRSRVAANGILLLSSAMSMVQTRDQGDDDEPFDDSVASDTFMEDFTAAMLAPLDDDGSAQQVVPLVLRGDIEDLNAVKHITLQRADAERLIERQRAALLRLLHSLDVQPEQVEGMGAVNHWCVDDQTEVLSTRGWLRQDQLDKGDVVLTINHDTGLSEWQPVLDIYRADVTDEPMILMDGRTHSSMTTPDHKWATTRTRQRNFETYTDREFTLTRDLGVQHHIPTAAACADQPTTAKYDDDLVELVAWFWTEGNIKSGGGGSIAQSHSRNPERVARIRAALTRTFGAASPSLLRLGRPGWREAIQENRSSYGGPVTVFHLNRDALSVLVDVAPGKVVRTDFIRDLTPAQLELFVHVSCMGDGWHYRGTLRGSQLDIWQRDPAALEAFELALILSGRAIHRGESGDGHYVSTLRSGTVRPVKANAERLAGRNPGALAIEQVNYTGTIWCPVTTNHTWFARRNGTAYFTGNSGWQIDARSIKTEVQPAANVVAACHMKAFLQPALESLGHSAADIAKITIVADCSDLAENPNRGQDARDAWDRYSISDEALRRELGFDEDDAPAPDEYVRRLASLGRLPVEETAKVLGLRRDDPARPQTVPGQVVPSPDALPSSDRPVAQPGQATPEQAAPTMPSAPPNSTAAPSAPTGPVMAAATPDPDPFGMHVDEDACRALAAIDAALAERVAVAADAALARVLERAGARVRSAAQKDRALVAQLTNLETAAIPAALGRDRVEAFVPVADLVADEYSRLRGQVTGWLRDAGVQAGLAACEVMGLNPNGAAGQRLSASVTSQLSGHVDPAWRLLLEELHEAAEWALFDTGDDDEPGERTGSPLSAQDIADVLAVAGGDRPSIIASAADEVFARRDDKGQRRRHRRPDKKRRTRDTPGTGVATGPVMQSALAAEGAVLVGWEWDYREFVPRKMFEPHHRLDGTRVSTWSDPKLDTDARSSWIGPSFHPGDHNGCFIAGTEVSGPPATASFVRPYKGEGVEIRTDSGKVLTGTPNHPILTPRGWVPLGELDEGDEVVVAAGGERALPVDDQAYQVPALIEDVCAALPMADGVVTRPVPTAAEDFHGDGAGSDGQVTVVRADRRLLLDDEPTASQLGGDDVLLLGGHGHGPLATEGVAQTLVPGEGLAAHGAVRVPGDGLPVVDGGAVVSGESSLAAVPGGHTRLRDDSSDHGAVAPVLASKVQFADVVAVVGDDLGSGRLVEPLGLGVSEAVQDSDHRLLVDADLGGDVLGALPRAAQFQNSEHPRVVVGPVDGADRGTVVDQEALDGSVGYPLPTSEGMDRFAGGVTTEKVVGIRRLPLDCHVYNLTTVTGWYVANGVIVHNCQCGSIPIYATLDDPEGIVARRLAAAKGDPRRVAVDQLAAADDAAGRVGTSAQQTAEIRRRLTDAIDAMRAAHIEGPRKRRGKR